MQVARSHLTNIRGGVSTANEPWKSAKLKRVCDSEQPIFGPATLLFVGRRALRLCSLLTPRGQPKSLVAPSASLYAMASSFPRGATGAGEKWPISHIFPPFLTLWMREFFRQGWRRGAFKCGVQSAECGILTRRSLQTANEGAAPAEVFPHGHWALPRKGGPENGFVRFRRREKARKNGFGRFMRKEKSSREFASRRGRTGGLIDEFGAFLDVLGQDADGDFLHALRFDADADGTGDARELLLGGKVFVA